MTANNRPSNDIVLVNPPLSNEERYGIKFKAGGQTPPNGLAIVAAVAREKNWKVAIIDGAAEGLSFDNVVTKIKNYGAKYVGLTASTVSIFNAMEIAKRIRKTDKNIKIILGGAHLTAAPSETIEKFKEFIDYGVIGEGEITFPELIKALEKKKDVKKIKGIIYYKNNKLMRTRPREYICNLDEIPIPAWDLLPNLAKCYCPPVHTLKNFPAAMIVTSRGCPGQCTFCDNSIFGRRYRWHSPKYIISMIKVLKQKYGIKEIQFKDDNLLVNKIMLKELCEMMIKEKLDITWSCSGRVDMVNPEILKIMKAAGCWQIWYGLESGSNKVLKSLKKNITVEKIRYAIGITKDTGISSGGFFMVGNPDETEEDIKMTMKLLLELPLDEFHISHLTPFPGSELYRTADKYGEFDRNWKKMNGWNILFIPHGLTREKLVYYSNLAFRKFYLRPRIILNYIQKIKSIKLLKIYFEAFKGFMSFTRQKNR